MALSGSTDFTLVTNEIIDEAFDLCGIGSEGEAISADQYERARRSLNLILKAWGAQDRLWLRTEGSVTLVSSQANYALATLLSVKPGRVLSVRRKITANSVETPLMEWSRQEYYDQTNKATDSVPTAFYYDPQVSTGTLYVWPRPSTSTASTMTLAVTYLRRPQDFDSSSNDPDLPQEWLRALCYTLASELALKYGVAPDVRAEINARAVSHFEGIEGWDNEPASLYMSPDFSRC